MIKTRYPEANVDKDVYKDMHPSNIGVVKVHTPRKSHGNKYNPHQGNRERLKRLSKIYKSHPFDCNCDSCNLFDAVMASRQ